MKHFLAHTQIDNMLSLLHNKNYKCVAPRYIDGSIHYSVLNNASELPWGLEDEQSPGNYKIIKTNKKRAFAFTVPSQSVKPMLFKPKENIWKVIRDNNGKLVFEPQLVFEKIAVFGVRPCDLRAIEIQDKVFKDSTYPDIRYIKRRENQFIIAMNCTHSHSNCFCVSLDDKPQALSGFDLVMTEIKNGFVVASGSDKGDEFLSHLNTEVANSTQIKAESVGIECAITEQTKSIPPISEVESKLIAHPDHPRWDDVASRCLSCGNCTNSCPTCFCHTQKEEPNVSGTESYHTKEWDSCFTIGHSYTHGEIYREELRHRYRQWLTHKFATWRDQFDIKGCVGCGRCITHCPVKIDVTEEINHICAK